MNGKIIGVTVGSPLPKPNLMQDDPTKGDYVKGKEEFVKQIGGGNGEQGADGFSPIATVTQTENGAEISITDKDGKTVENKKIEKLSKEDIKRNLEDWLDIADDLKADLP